jgi:hypothetical protein
MDNREREKAIARLLRQGLRRGRRDSVAGCPDAETLAAYYERSLAADEAARCETHFSSCSHCQQQLAMLVRAEPALAETGKQSARAAWQHGYEPQPSAAPAAARATPSLDRDSWLGSFWQRQWRWLGPAAVAMCALALWVAVRPTPPRLAPASEQKEVALSVPPATPGSAANLNPPASKAPPRVLAPPKSAGREAPPGDALARLKREKAPSVSAGAAPSYNLAAAAERQKSKMAATKTRERAEKLAAAAAAPPPAVAAGAEQKLPLAAQEVVVGAPVAAPSPAPQPSAALASRSMESAPAARPHAETKLSPAMGALAVQNLDAASGERMTSLEMREVVIASPHPQVLWRLRLGTVVERSRDAGKTWKEQAVPAGLALLAGAAPSERVCWLVGRAGAVLRTTDAKSWKKLAPPVEADLLRVEARDAESAKVFAVDGTSFVTEDGGKTWHPQ